MTTSHAFPVLGCPACNAPLAGAASCPACGLRLVGPDAQLLWEPYRRLAPLLVERDLLLGRLRGAAGPMERRDRPARRCPGRWGGRDPPARATRADRPGLRRTASWGRWPAAGLCGAGLAAWSYGRLGPAARCGALVAAAGASVAASWVAARRGHGQGARRRSWLRRSVRRRLRRRPAPRARPSLRRTRTRSAGGPNTAGTRRQTPPRPSGLGSPRPSRPRCSSRYLIRPAAPDGCSCCYRSARPF